MTIAVPGKPTTVPGVMYTLSVSDALDLEHLLAQLDQTLTVAYATDVRIPLIPAPLQFQARVAAVRAMLTRNKADVLVPAESVTPDESDQNPYAVTDFVKDGQDYKVIIQVGYLDKDNPAAGWDWEDVEELQKTRAQFNAFPIPSEQESERMKMRTRIRLYNESGKIAMERFGYK